MPFLRSVRSSIEFLFKISFFYVPTRDDRSGVKLDLLTEKVKIVVIVADI